MKTFSSIREFIVPEPVCDETDRVLREAGLGRNEHFVLWSGVIDKERFLARTLHNPHQTASRLESGLCVRVGGDELDRINRWLYENGERLAVQVHSHPTEAFHSDTDDAFPMVTTLGGPVLGGSGLLPERRERTGYRAISLGPRWMGGAITN